MFVKTKQSLVTKNMNLRLKSIEKCQKVRAREISTFGAKIEIGTFHK